MSENTTLVTKSLRELVEGSSGEYCDSDYRRGFVHGICEAIDALEWDEADTVELCEYVDYLMDHWRYVNTDQLIPNPVFKLWKQNQRTNQPGPKKEPKK